MLYQLAYMSTTPRAWTRPELLHLLRQARTSNRRRDVTGVLLHRGQGFVQLLEGAQEQVDDLYGRIADDARHTQVKTIWTARGAERWFGEWSMGFRDLEDDPVTEPGLTDVLRGAVDASAFSHEVVVQLWGLLRPVPGGAGGLGPLG